MKNHTMLQHGIMSKCSLSSLVVVGREVVDHNSEQNIDSFCCFFRAT